MADRSGYIGRAPGDSSIIVARQTHSPTGVQTDFTFASGYTVGYIDAYLNGSRLINAEDYTATDGTTVGLTSSANNGDILELVAYKAFNLANVAESTGNFSVGNNLTVTDDLTVSGDTTSIVNITGTAGTFTDLTVTDQFTGNATGTAATFTTITATDQFSGNISGVAATFTGPVTIGGTLTYEDATNVDSVGLVTARTGVRVTAGGIVVTTGVSTFAAVDINGSVLTLDADGDTTITADTDDQIDIAFGGNDRLTLSTGLIDLKNDGSQSAIRLYCESSNAHYAALQAPAHSAFSGNITLTLPATTDTLVARTTTDTLTNKTLTSPSITGDVSIADKIVHTGDTNTALRFPAADTFTVETAGSERVRVDSAGLVGIGTIAPQRDLHIHNSDSSTNTYLQLTSATTGTTSTDGFQLWAYGSGGNQGAVIAQRENADIEIWTNNTERLRITSAGDVGLGVTDATILNDSGFRELVIGGATEGAAIHLQDADGNVKFGAFTSDISNAAFIRTVTNHPIVFRTNNTERIRITSDGNIGIGQTNPQGNLHIGNISGSKNLVMHAANNGDATIRFREGGNNASGFNEYSIGMDGSRNDIVVSGQGAGEILALKGDTGLVGIGTINPTGLLEVSGNDGVNISNATRTGTNGAQWRFIPHNGSGSATNLRIYEGVGATEVINITKAGLIGINETNPGHFLDMNIGSTNVGIKISSTDAGAYIQFADNSTTDETRCGAVANDFKIDVNGSERLRITSTGIAQFSATGRVATFTGNGIEINNAGGSNIFIGTQSGAEGKIGTVNNSSMALFANNDYAKRVEVQTTGDLSLIDGNLIVANGHGINFSARTPDGTVVSNELLDDYEEGTWTATVENYTSSVTSTISNATGVYTKVGNVVTCSWYSSVISLSGSQSGAAQIGGLPFVSVNSANVYQVANFAHANSFAHTITNGYTVPNESRVVLVQNNSTSTTTWNTSGGNRYVMMQITYLTAT